MSRALWLSMALLSATQPPIAVAQSTDSDERARAVHVLNRLTFGPRPGDVERVLAMGVDRWIEQQLARSITQAYDASYPGCAAWIAPVDSIGIIAASSITAMSRIVVRGEMRTAPVQTMIPRATPLSVAFQSTASPRRAENVRLLTCKLMQAERSEQQLHEVVADLWLNHFSVWSGGVQDRASIVTYERAIRPHVLGRFRDLLGAVAHSPAMLMYLDNHISGASPDHRTQPEFRQGHPAGYYTMPRYGLNENFGRELLELHTLGVDGGYTQQDVIDVARAFTGWTHTGWRSGCMETPVPGSNLDFTRLCRTVDTTLPQFRFDREVHDADRKTVLGHTIAEGRGIEDGEEVLDILARHPATARHIARKLAIRLISDVPPQTVIDRAAETFMRTDGDLREVVRAIVTSAEFNDERYRGGKIRSPVELVLAIRRALDAPYDSAGRVVETLINLDQVPFGHQAPDGWPETAAGWMNTGALVNRVNFARSVAFGDVKSIPLEQWRHWTELAALPYEQQVDRVIALLLHSSASPHLRTALLAAAPERPEKPGSIAAELSLRNLISLVLGSPDFQRR